MEPIKVIIFDADGVLLDMVYAAYQVAPWLHKIDESSPLWELLRKFIILFRAEKILDDRIRKTVYMANFENVAKYCDYDEKFVITNRPFVFGGKKHLIRQLNYVYGENFFPEENVYSAFFAKNKAAVIKKYILRPGMFGIMLDDHADNFEGIPEEIKTVLVSP